MAGAHVQTKDAQTGAGTSVGVSLTGVVAANHLTASGAGFTSLAANLQLNLTTSSPAATWTNAIAATNQTIGAAAQGIRCDYSENVASGSWTVTLNMQNSGSITGNASESSGVKTSGSLGTHNVTATTTSSTAQPGSITPTAGSVLYSMFGDDSANTAAPSIGSSFVLRSDSTSYNGANERAAQASLDNAAASATNPTWTESSGTANWVAGIVEFLAAAAAAGTVGRLVGPMQNTQGLVVLQAVKAGLPW